MPQIESPLPHLPVEIITIGKRHDETEIHPCMLCKTPTQKVYLSHEMWTNYKAIRAEEMPAYRCDDCGGLETFNTEGVIEFLTQAIGLINPTKDPIIHELLRQELTAALIA
ncbi:hypothetical protein HY404_02080 [Candidatus Microgenomates bacterium]|nr:hypothetical protein [Candidatus Microgenomates bacterium]